MSRYLRLSLAWLVLLLLSLPMLAQAPPSADSYVAKITPSTNYGSAPILAVQEGTTTYIQFDLSALPESPSIGKATLRLYVDNVLAPGSFDVYQLNEKWDEKTISYSNAPALGTSATGGKPINISASSLNHFILVDITALAQGWLNGSVPNNGVALELVRGSTGNLGSFSFDSKENALTGHQPELQLWCTSWPADLEALPSDAPNAGMTCLSQEDQTCCLCNDFKSCSGDPQNIPDCNKYCKMKTGFDDSGLFHPKMVCHIAIVYSCEPKKGKSCCLCDDKKYCDGVAKDQPTCNAFCKKKTGQDDFGMFHKDMECKRSVPPE